MKMPFLNRLFSPIHNKLFNQLPAKANGASGVVTTSAQGPLLLVTVLLAGLCLSPLYSPAAEPTLDIKLIAINDFHGNLEPPAGKVTNEQGVAVRAGGAVHLANAIQKLIAQNPLHAVVSAGDLVGASPLASGLFLDEGAVEVANLFPLDFNEVGNHEFDKGWQELRRLQTGGCAKFTERPPCALSSPFEGAQFQFLAANVRTPDGATLFPGSALKTWRIGQDEIKIGFIGMTLRATPTMVTPKGVAGLRFDDEAQTANRLVAELKAQGANTVVLLIHQGGQASNKFQDAACPDLDGDILPIVAQLDPAIQVVISGHTHRAYLCRLPNPAASDPKGRLLTSAGYYGTLLTNIDLQFDPRTKQLVGTKATNQVVEAKPFDTANSINEANPKVTAKVSELVSRYVQAAQSVAGQKVGFLSESLLAGLNAQGVSPLGWLIADSQLAATQGADQGRAQLALMNPGGVRAPLLVPQGGGPVNFGEVYNVQPFGNALVTKSYTGAQLKALLEEQFGGAYTRMLYPSKGLTYEINNTAPWGQRVQNLRLNGEPLEAAQTYRVTMNAFLADGGDRFNVAKQGLDAWVGPLDLDAFAAYLNRQSPVSAPQDKRFRNSP